MKVCVLASILLACIGCQPKSQPDILAPPVFECSTDSDCGLSGRILSGEARCCDECGETAANKAWLHTFEASCLPKSADRECPVYHCPRPEPMVAVCNAGKCEAVKAEAELAK